MSRRARADDDEFDLPPPAGTTGGGRKRAREISAADGGGSSSSTAAAAAAAAPAAAAAAAASSQALMPYGEGGAEGAESARPVAITKHGPRQYVEAENGMRIFLQNVVASCNLQCRPDLQMLQSRARNTEYNPQRFAAAIMRLTSPKATALIFNSGKMVVTGSKNEEDCFLAARSVAAVLTKLNVAVALKDFVVQNMVATTDCGFPIRLEGIADDELQRENCSFEPELFPGLIYKLRNPKVVLLVFVSGKVVITGAKTRTAIVQAMDMVLPLLTKYKKKSKAERAEEAEEEEEE